MIVNLDQEVQFIMSAKSWDYTERYVRLQFGGAGLLLISSEMRDSVVLILLLLFYHILIPR